MEPFQPPPPSIDQIWESFEKLQSKDRLDKYVWEKDPDKTDALARYYWNVGLSEALYPALQALELAFRNTLHNTLTDVKGQPNWYDCKDLLEQRELDQIAAARKRLSDQNKPDDPGRVVAELTFGFWTSLLDRRYDRKIAVPCMAKAFPNLESRNRTRKYLSKRFASIRRLRNRISHHEPIWHWSDLSDQHDRIYETISWIDPTVAQISRRFDRFTKVKGDGWDPQREKIQRGVDRMRKIYQERWPDKSDELNPGTS